MKIIVIVIDSDGHNRIMTNDLVGSKQLVDKSVININ